MSRSKPHREGRQRQAFATPDVRMIPVAITACGMAAVGTGGHRWTVIGAGIGCLVAGMIDPTWPAVQGIKSNTGNAFNLLIPSNEDS